MTERISPARLAEIEQVTERVRGHTYREPVYLALTELLAELREVTRERDEARAKYDHVKEERDKLKAECAAMREALTLLHKYDTGTGCHTYEDIKFVRADALSTNAGADLLFERDKLKQELADLNYKAGNEYAIVTHYKAEMEHLAAKVESLEEFYDTHVGDALKADALRAENAKLKAVAKAAKTVNMLLEYSGLPAQEWRVSGHIALSTAVIGDLRDALAALDQPCTQGDPKEGA